MEPRPAYQVLEDDLHEPVRVLRRPRRVVSLVPSLTEAIAATDLSLLAGATHWCTQPPGLALTRVRGTKNPDLTTVRSLEPDLVVANMEENRKVDVQRLRASGIPTWVTRIESVPEAIGSLTRLITLALGCPEPSWLAAAAAAWSPPAGTSPLAGNLPHPDPSQPPKPAVNRTRGAPPQAALRVVVPIWRDPWMVVGGGTYADDVLTRCELRNVYSGSSEHYPTVDIKQAAESADLVLLPDEPYPFSGEDGPEAFSVPVALVPGRALTWYGPAMVTARDELRRAIHDPVHRSPDPPG